MSLRGALRRLAGSLSRRRADAELDAEIGFHIEMETEENLRRGLAPDQARRAAMRSFGRVGHTKSAYQEARGLPWLEDAAGDTRIALRTIRRTPAFSAAVIGLMALGIGANAAVFTVVDGVLLRPLPYPRADQIAQLEQVHRQWSGAGHDGATVEALRRSNDETQAAALCIAVAGIYGALAASVSQRSREIAIRMALGATPGRVMRGILGEGLAVAAVGVSIGLVAARPLRPLLARFLYGAAAFDPATAGAVAAVLLAAALVASLAPAARAARIHPAANLRQG